MDTDRVTGDLPIPITQIIQAGLRENQLTQLFLQIVILLKQRQELLQQLLWRTLEYTDMSGLTGNSLRGEVRVCIHRENLPVLLCNDIKNIFLQTTLSRVKVQAAIALPVISKYRLILPPQCVKFFRDGRQCWLKWYQMERTHWMRPLSSLFYTLK